MMMSDDESLVKKVFVARNPFTFVPEGLVPKTNFCLIEPIVGSRKVYLSSFKIFLRLWFPNSYPYLPKIIPEYTLIRFNDVFHWSLRSAA